LVEINYDKSGVFLQDNKRNRRRINRKYSKAAISIERENYINTSVVIDSVKP
jgi:hypothetical protein